MPPIHYVLTSVILSVLLNAWMTSATSNKSIPVSHRSPIALAATSTQPISDAAKQNRSGAIAKVYSFTMTLPDHTAKGFAKLSFSEQTAAAPVWFNLKQTQAFVGTPNAPRQAIDVADAWVDETGTIWVEFNPSLPPKTTLTVTFKPQKQPSARTYNYGIAAYPQAVRSVPVYVGNQTLTVSQ